MAAPKTPKKSIAELEQEIAKLSAALDKARAQELTAAEKIVAAEQKALINARKKAADLAAKDNKTPAVKARLLQVKKDLATQTKTVANAQALLGELKTAQASAKEVAKAVAEQLKGKAKKTTKTVKAKPSKIETPKADLTPKAEKPTAKKAAKKDATVETKTATVKKTDAAKAKARPKANPEPKQPAVAPAQPESAPKKSTAKKAPVKKPEAKTEDTTPAPHLEAPEVVDAAIPDEVSSSVEAPIIETPREDTNVESPEADNARLPLADDSDTLH